MAVSRSHFFSSYHHPRQPGESWAPSIPLPPQALHTMAGHGSACDECYVTVHHQHLPRPSNMCGAWYRSELRRRLDPLENVQWLIQGGRRRAPRLGSTANLATDRVKAQPVKAGRSLSRISLDRRQSSSGQKGGLSDDAHLGIRKSSPTFHREAGMTDSPSVHSGAGIHQFSPSLGRAICSGPGTVLSHDAAELLDDTAVGPKYRMRRVPRWIRHQLRPIDFAGWDADGVGSSSAVARNPFGASFFCELERSQKSHVPVAVGSGLKGSVASARFLNQVTCICSFGLYTHAFH
ncbi:hypothetical protein C8R46DRAFT_1301929 [Mycena filopes]|nr:hypothetical protein C8R46DRAFT_1301929 [Mycena filopes]